MLGVKPARCWTGMTGDTDQPGGEVEDKGAFCVNARTSKQRRDKGEQSSFLSDSLLLICLDVWISLWKKYFYVMLLF